MVIYSQLIGLLDIFVEIYLTISPVTKWVNFFTNGKQLLTFTLLPHHYCLDEFVSPMNWYTSTLDTLKFEV